jgi:aryl-alcohol dehydrogenase-like predicted oxidoreductase
MKVCMESRATRRFVLQATGAVVGVGLLTARASLSAAADSLPLIKKPIPSSKEMVPVVGLGTNNFDVGEPADLAARKEVLQGMPGLGGSVVDTAPLYGRSEAVIGNLVAELGNRDRLFFATKVMSRDSDGADGKASIEESFRRLRTERIDLMQVHNLAGVEQLIPVLQALKQAKRIRYFGITTSNPAQHPQMMELMKRFPLDFIQVDYSIDNREVANSVLPLALERHVGVLINSPLGGRRGAASVFSRVANRPLPDWAAAIDAQSWAQVFLKYVVSHPAVTCALSGTTQLKHLDDNLRGARGRLPDAAMRVRMEKYWDSNT